MISKRIRKMERENIKKNKNIRYDNKNCEWCEYVFPFILWIAIMIIYLVIVWLKTH